VPPRFTHFAAIDWSGAAGTSHKGIAVAICAAGDAAPVLVAPPSPRGWARTEVLRWLVESAPPTTMIGFDMGISLAHADCGAFFPGWAQSPADARALWALVEEICAGEPDLGVAPFLAHPQAARHFRQQGGRLGDLFPTSGPTGARGRWRVAEEAQAAMGCAPTSNFNLVGAAQVGKASLAGMRLLHRLPDSIAVWPVDEVAPRRKVVAEIYTAIAAIAAGRRAGASKIRSHEALAEALAHPAIASAAPTGTGPIADHAADALLTAAWLRRHAHLPALWAPARLTPALAHTEGWTFGVA